MYWEVSLLAMLLAGNVGGKERLEYTGIGDPVNLAARLESLTKEWKTPVLLITGRYHLTIMFSHI